MVKKKDIMDNILGGEGKDTTSRIEELNCLIYKAGSDDNHDMPDDRKGAVIKSSKDNVSVQVWEGKAKIKVKVSPGKKKNVSMKRIADIAVNAILEELKKEV